MNKKTKESREQDERFEKRVKAFVYIILRVAVVGVMIAQIYNQNWNNVFNPSTSMVIVSIISPGNEA